MTPKRQPINNHDGTFCIPLTRGKQAIIDAGDLPLVEHLNWLFLPLKTGEHRSGYAASRTSDGTWLLMHRVILQPEDGFVADHIDRDGLNNRRMNLRQATQHQNTMNRRPASPSSGYKGVYRSGTRFRAIITYAGQQINLGSFANPEEAARAYDQAARTFFGQFAYLNCKGVN